MPSHASVQTALVSPSAAASLVQSEHTIHSELHLFTDRGAEALHIGSVRHVTRCHVQCRPAMLP